MARGIQILGYRNLDQAYAFIRDQRDEAKIYASDEGADQTEFCIQLADGRWRNPLPPLVDRARYGEDMTDEEIDSDLEAYADGLDDDFDDEFDNELDVAANALLNGSALADEPDLSTVEKDAAVPVVAPPVQLSSRTAVLNEGKTILTRFNRPCDNRKSWKSKKVPAQFARHST